MRVQVGTGNYFRVSIDTEAMEKWMHRQLKHCRYQLRQQQMADVLTRTVMVQR